MATPTSTITNPRRRRLRSADPPSGHAGSVELDHDYPRVGFGQAGAPWAAAQASAPHSVVRPVAWKSRI